MVLQTIRDVVSAYPKGLTVHDLEERLPFSNMGQRVLELVHQHRLCVIDTTYGPDGGRPRNVYKACG